MLQISSPIRDQRQLIVSYALLLNLLLLELLGFFLDGLLLPGDHM